MIQSNCWKRGLLAATLGFIAQPGRVNSEPTTAQELPAIVVTPLRGEQSQSDSPAQVHLISPTEDAAGVSARNLPETLREIPSVMVQKTGHGMGSPFLRGFTGFRTLTLVDGVRLNHSVFREGPNQYLSTIDPLSLRVVEVLMGPGSVLYGSDAIGGVLQVLPVEPMDWTGTPDWSGRAILRSAPGEDSVWGRLEFSARPSESLGLIGGVSAKSLGDLRGGKDVGHQPKTGYDEQAGDLRLRWGLAEDVSLTLTHQSVRQDDVWRTHRTVYGLTWKGLKAGDDQRHEFDQARQLTIARLEAGANAATGPFTLTLSRQVQSEDLVRVRKDGRTDRQGFEVTAWGAAAQAGRVTDFGRFDYGVDLQLDEVDSYSRKYSAEDRLQKTEIQGP
ncbi:MAG: TonB-dependent receptor plug domain-containing protein, partial [Kiritimatiellia bacterium]|nr:TonB-dependent receptor plug domain-containing protein [Kiritimatiellia bacterium]